MEEEEIKMSESQIRTYLKDKNQKPLRETPSSDLDFNFQVTENVWGKEGSISPELKRRLINIKSANYDEKTGEISNLTYDSLWEVLGFYTRDLRLSNLDEKNYRAVVHYLNLAGDYLGIEFLQAFMICLSRVASIIEVSQSKKGFLRVMLNSIFQHTEYKGLEPEKRSLLSGKKQDGGHQR